LTPVKSFDGLWAELSAKVATSAEGSGTVDAVGRGVHYVGKKVVEEAAEAWMAAEHEGADRAADEIAQLLYQVQVLMLASGVALDDVYERL
jgi:phosphoribosyl-ATP pyrophosphohydrolase